MRTPWMPQATIPLKLMSGSGVTLSAKPCQVIQRLAHADRSDLSDRTGPDQGVRPRGGDRSEPVILDRLEAPGGWRTRPRSRVRRDPERGETALREDAQQHLLDAAQIPVEVHPVRVEVQDRVAHELARAVIRDVPAPLDLDHVHPLVREPGRVGQRVLLPRTASDGDHRQVFDEK